MIAKLNTSHAGSLVIKATNSISSIQHEMKLDVLGNFLFIINFFYILEIKLKIIIYNSLYNIMKMDQS